MKVLITLVAALAIFLRQGTRAADAQAHDPASVIAAALTQVNAGNLDGLMAYFADDAIANVNGTLYSGKAAIREFMQWSLGQHLQATVVGDYQVSGSRVTWRETDVMDFLREMGVASINNDCEAVVENGLIKSISFTADAASLAEIQRAQAAAPAGMPKTGENALSILTSIALLGVALPLLGIMLQFRKSSA